MCIRDRLQALRQRLFLVAVNRQGLLAAQAGGDFIETVRQRFGLFQQLRLRFLWQLFAAVCAECRKIAEQGVRQHQKAKAEVGILTEVPRFHEHVAEGGGQRRVGVVRVAPGQAVTEVVTLAAGVLGDDLAQVGAVAAQRCLLYTSRCV